MSLPEVGIPREEIIKKLAAFKEHDLAWRDGRVFAYTFNAGHEAEALVKEAFSMYLSENALDPTTFPSTMQMERDIVRMTAGLMSGDEKVVGNFTTGGTESIMLAMKTARDWAKANRPFISKPEIILCQTAHAAFHKAAHYLGLNKVIVPFDENYRADVKAMRDAITENTILLVASAPNYSHGIIDPIEKIASLALENNLLCHVDACIGGFQLAFMRKLGYPVAKFDFELPGVTSISIDPHKYGYSAKGSSIILYRNKELRRFQIFASLSTTSYAIINPTILSTKSGGPLAATWAIMNYFGEAGYMQLVKEVIEATRKLIDGINSTADLTVLGRPDMSIFALSSQSLNVFQLADCMKSKGWYLQPQFSKSSPHPNIHLTVNHANVAHVDQFLVDLAAAVEETKKQPKLDPLVIKEQVEMMLANITAEDAAAAFYELAGIEGSALPGDMAFINTVLNALPPEIAESMLVEYFNDLFV